MSQVDGDAVNDHSGNKLMDIELVTSYPLEFLSSLELLGESSHQLWLKVGPIDEPRQCNGTK